MILRVRDITAALEELAPLDWAEDFDNVGLLVGDKKAKVSGALVALDVTEAVLEEAIEKNCNLILSFHPIIFKGLKCLTGENYVQRIVQKAIKKELHIYAIHTALDNSLQGVNAMICSKLGIGKSQVLLPKDPSVPNGIGMGMVGDLGKEENVIDFFDRIRTIFDVPYIRHSRIIKDKIQRVAVLGGSGGFAIEAAKAASADVFITSDLKYHQFFEAEEELLLADIGHYESEQFTKDVMRAHIKEKFPNFVVQNSVVKTNPVNYYP